MLHPLHITRPAQSPFRGAAIRNLAAFQSVQAEDAPKAKRAEPLTGSTTPLPKWYQRAWEKIQGWWRQLLSKLGLGKQKAFERAFQEKEAAFLTLEKRFLALRQQYLEKNEAIASLDAAQLRQAAEEWKGTTGDLLRNIEARQTLLQGWIQKSKPVGEKQRQYERMAEALFTQHATYQPIHLTVDSGVTRERTLSEIEAEFKAYQTPQVQKALARLAQEKHSWLLGRLWESKWPDAKTQRLAKNAEKLKQVLQETIKKQASTETTQPGS